MREQLTNTIFNTLKEYEERHELLKLEKEEIKNEVAKTERARKVLEKMGVKAEIEESKYTLKDLEEIERDIKMVKAVIRRLETVLAMFSNDGVIEIDEEIQEEVEQEQVI